MAMNKFHKDRISKKIKCFYKKSKDENSYVIIFDKNKIGILFGSKNDECTFVVSTEKQIYDLPKEKKMKTISFERCIKNIIAMMMKESDAKFPIDAYGFSNIFLGTFMNEFSKARHKKSTMPPIQCQGG